MHASLLAISALLILSVSLVGADVTASTASNDFSMSVITPTPVALVPGINASLDVQFTIPSNSTDTACITEIIEANQLVFVHLAAGEAVMSRMTIFGSRRYSSPYQRLQGSCVDTVEMLHFMQIWGGELGVRSLSVTVNTSTNVSLSIQIPVIISPRVAPRPDPPSPFNFKPILKYGGIAFGAVVGLVAFVYLWRWFSAWYHATSPAGSNLNIPEAQDKPVASAHTSQNSRVASASTVVSSVLSLSSAQSRLQEALSEDPSADHQPSVGHSRSNNVDIERAVVSADQSAIALPCDRPVAQSQGLCEVVVEARSPQAPSESS